MTNAELIKVLRYCIQCRNCDGCDFLISHNGVLTCKAHGQKALLQAAVDNYEKLIAELTLDNKMLKNTIDADKGVMLDRFRFLEAQLPKEAHWVAVENGHGVCSNCNRQDSIDNMATHCRYCGARMTKGEDK